MNKNHVNISYNHIFEKLNIFIIAFDDTGLIVESQGDYQLIGLAKKPACREYLQSLFSINTHSSIYQFVGQYLKDKDEIEQDTHIPVEGFFELKIYSDQGLHFLSISKKKQVITKEEVIAYEKVIKCYKDRYRSLIETDPVMHVSIDPSKGVIVDCNEMTVSRLGYPSKDSIIGRPVYELFAPEKRGKCLSLIDKFKRKGFLIKEEMELVTSQEEVIPVLLYTNAERDEYGNILYSRSTLVDISDLKKAEELLQKKRAYLELLNNQLEYFMLTCSHDLKEPLGTIKLSIDVILKLYKGDLPDKVVQYLLYVDESVDRMNKQISLLLTHAKLGRMSNKSEVVLKDLLEVVLQDLGASISQSKAEITFPEQLPVIKVYKTEFRLLLQNILSNAIKYSRENVSPKIEVIYTYSESYHVFEIKDNGIGIHPEDSSRIFQIFNDVYSDNPNKGSGIGLSHCKKIVELHGGTITVSSVLNEGTSFVFSIASV